MLIAARQWSPDLSALGSLLSIGMFLSTLSLLCSTPGLWHVVDRFPLPVTTADGGFLMKDVFLLGTAIWTAGEALRATRRGAEHARRAPKGA